MYGMLPANESDWPIPYLFGNDWSCWQKGVLFVVLHLTLLCTVFKQTIFRCLSSVLI